MKRYALLLLPLLLLTGAIYRSKDINQSWRFDNAAILDQMDPLSGRWEILSPAKLNLSLLSQTIKYADFPKVLIKDNDYYDFVATTRVYISSGNEDTQSGGLVLRYRNLYSYYMLFINTKDKRITLTRAGMGGFKVVKRVNYSFEPDRWYTLSANCYLDRIRALVDDQVLLEAKDNGSTGGKIGLVTAGTSQVYFEALRVKAEGIEIIREPQPTQTQPTQTQPTQTQPSQ
jgi:hypothetical protein